MDCRDTIAPNPDCLIPGKKKEKEKKKGLLFGGPERLREGKERLIYWQDYYYQNNVTSHYLFSGTPHARRGETQTIHIVAGATAAFHLDVYDEEIKKEFTPASSTWVTTNEDSVVALLERYFEKYESLWYLKNWSMGRKLIVDTRWL